VGLSHEIVKRLRSIFSRENLIAHPPNLIRFNRARKQKTENRSSFGVGRWAFGVRRFRLS
jgi:hypothetical protein